MPVPSAIQQEAFRVGTVSLLLDDTVLYHLHDDVIIEVEDIFEMMNAHQKIAGDKPRYVIVNSGARATLSQEARALDVSKQRKELTLAEAVVIDNIVTRIAASFYYRFNAPPYSIRTFPDIEKAMKWIDELRQNESQKKNNSAHLFI
jgi:hypothetical protein